jgi:hypothetical protein
MPVGSVLGVGDAVFFDAGGAFATVSHLRRQKRQVVDAAGDAIDV